MWAKNIMLGKTSAIRSGALLSIGAKNWGVEPRAANGANTGVLECLLGSRDLGQLDAPDEVGLALNTPVATLSTIAGKAAELVLSQGRRVVKKWGDRARERADPATSWYRLERQPWRSCGSCKSEEGPRGRGRKERWQ